MNREPDQLVHYTTLFLVGLATGLVTGRVTGHPLLAAIAGVAIPAMIQQPIADKLVELGF